MTDTHQHSAAMAEQPAEPQRLEREVIKDLEMSDELADKVNGGNRPAWRPTALDPTSV